MKLNTQVRKEEFFNTISHGLGIVFGIIGTLILVWKALDSKQVYSLTASLIFGVSIILLYSASTIYHLNWDKSYNHKLRIFDHISIYFLIAGTYTPFTLLVLKDSSGIWMFFTVWSLAIIGTVYKLFFTGKFKFVSLTIYLGMGWLVVFDFRSVFNLLNTQSLAWLIAGGLSYTLGTFFYSMKKIPFNHAIWHVFVLGGTVCHYFSVLGLF